MDASNHDGVINSTTSWTLAGGSLPHSMSVESSFTTKQESDDESCPTAVDHVAKSPVLLLPPVPNGEPYEVTITFAQERQLRQVYIRSSAPVYEVYYTKKRRHDEEYLSTVRCVIPMRGEEVLQIPLSVLADSKNGVEPVKDSSERKVKDDGDGRRNEDDWIEVKAGDGSLMNSEKYLLSMPQLGKQDFFEATAEIDDAEPCVSITLRLLSLQDRGCAVVDEVYVFADPVDAGETDQEETSGTGNSSSSSLMAMFMPALSQLSREKDVRKERDRQVFKKSKSTNLGTLGNSNDSDKIVNEIQPVLVDTLAKQISGAEITHSVSCNNVETILDQLVNKVSRIETILARFEDRMLKPINSIDARLQIVEKKLEQLCKKSFESELVSETKLPNPDSLGSDTDKTYDTNELDGLTKITGDPQLGSCTKVVVPDFSITTSEDCAVVLPQKRLDNNLTKSVELRTENDSISENETVSTEPGSSNEKVCHSLGKGSFEEKPKHALSMNDALASAFSGLHSIADRKYCQALIVTAPEFSSEDDIETEEKPQNGPNLYKSQVAEEELGNTYSASEIPTSSHGESGITTCTETNSRELIQKVFEAQLPNPDSLGSDTGKTYDTNELDGLTKITGDPQLASCTKVVVPDFSITTSEDCAVVLPQKRLDNNLTKSVELRSENDSISGIETVSAEPESSNEEVCHSLGKGSFEEKPKHALSINDALASAFAGLFSSHSIADRKYKQALIVTAPEFSSEDDTETEEKPQNGPHLDKSQVAEEELGNTYSASEIPSSSHGESGITPCTETNSRDLIYRVSETKLRIFVEFCSKANSIAIKNKTSGFKTRLRMLSLVKHKKLGFRSISNKIHNFLGHAEQDQDKSKAIILYNSSASTVAHDEGYDVQEEDNDKYPDLRQTLFEGEEDFGDLEEGEGSSVIDMVRNSKEEEGRSFKLEDEIDHVADLFKLEDEIDHPQHKL